MKIRLSLARVGLLLLIGCATARPEPAGSAAAPQPLVFGASPIADRQARLKEIGGVARYLEQKLKRPITLEVPDTYPEAAEAMAQKKWDLALVGPILYARAHETGYDALAMPVRAGTMVFTGAVVARADSGLKNLAALKGKRVAFVDPNSSSGFQYPFALLLANGLKTSDYQRTFLGGNRAVVRAVFEGRADAAGCYEDALEQALTPVERAQMVVLGRTDPVPGDVFAARRDGPELEALRQALLALSADPSATEILSPLRATALSAPDESLFDSARRIDLLVSEEGGL